MWVTFFLVGLGGGLGAALRHGMNLGLLRLAGAWLPWGTLAANLVGSFALGWLMEAATGLRVFGVDLRLVLGTGLLGGFTTYSSFNLETIRLLEQGVVGRAALYVAATVLLCLGAGVLGLRFGQRL
jgi:CrcB protein